MSRPLKITLAGGCTLAVVVVLLAVYVLVAVRQVDQFYASALKAPPKKLEDDSRELESRVAALYSDATPVGRWNAVFTDNEVNGWLAVTLAEKFPDVLPPEVTDPRIAFAGSKVLVGFHWRGQKLDAVVSVEADAAMAEDDVIAVRIRQARAGSLPLPLSNVVEHVSSGAAQMQWPLQWTYEEGDPVALVPMLSLFSTEDRRRRLETLEVRDGEILLAGTTVSETEQRVSARAGGD